MDLTRRVAQLPPRRRRRVERLALASAAVCAVITVLLLTASAASVQQSWGRSTPEVAVSAALAMVGLLLTGVAAVNAQRTLRAPNRPAPEPTRTR